MSDADKITVTLDRRGFLAGIGVAFSSAPLSVLAGTADLTAHGKAMPKRAVYNQQSYISFDGTGEAYEHPGGNKSTRDYINSLSREEYLRRHWFI